MKKAKSAFGEELHVWLYYSCFKIYRISAAQALSPVINMDLTIVPVWLRTTLKQLIYLIIRFTSILLKVYSFFLISLHFRRGALTLITITKITMRLHKFSYFPPFGQFR